MEKLKVLNQLTECGVVAVVRANSQEEALGISEACVKGGIKGIEITFTVQGAEEIIRNLAANYQSNPDVVIGAGTVLDAVTARIAILAGAKFIVSPCFDQETAELCNLYQVPYMPGCMTITEMKEALKSGVDIIKLFPGNTFGPDWIKGVKAPLPQVNIMPTGGVDLDNVEKWIQNGCVAVGVGGSLVAHAKTGDFDKITEDAKQFVEKVQQAREALV
ncbi:bifunctional 4-hydroxy-2-oxoglutarate aldolase/2-dehydro-3-deoxy-phosphogluconate aldolase [Sporosarcina ureilytica]|uniref:Bifunctional 2-keto-4-hydroxyglutarate aldolase/2-keto-3-deoxy-6-phosphogluconate aldolase n=1 Tax=Sporosarcina ureilytica TaxID=298596 RepID=A0A1D8JIT4_9BACL|nr:bifunctional 4-hydroxy-2-oxoglutarate aldolase/2-dehydro-3-deoxy-phosphogluconate aldolase [Sporosarcina ureilytica]AOV08618.1 bifunctional 2-keto-4-hydroxyglutarate aldolase/2-keto-3-deoxy-6-phosphogluconate aldolase [Sporosarcina ureilytica]